MPSMSYLMRSLFHDAKIKREIPSRLNWTVFSADGPLETRQTNIAHRVLKCMLCDYLAGHKRFPLLHYINSYLGRILNPPLKRWR